MDRDKLFDEKLKKRIEKEKTLLPEHLNQKISDTLHNIPVQNKSYRVQIMAVSAAIMVLSLVSMLEFSVQSFAQKGGVFEYVTKKAFSDYENEEETKSNVNYPEKEKIHQKMLDSIDYFKNVTGQFEEYTSSSHLITTYKYAIDTENKRGISSKEDRQSKKMTILYNNGKRQEFNDKDATYKEVDWKPEPKNKELLKLTPTERVFNKVGEKKRYDGEYVGFATYSIQSEFADLLIRYKDWNFKEIKYLGLDCYKIEGVINIEMPVSTSEDLQGEFEMIVEKNTGIMLNFLSFDKGMIQYSITTEKIQINKRINENVYQKDVSSYEKLKNVLSK
ncbi:anti-sigma factor [Bacillus arachidis]|uniref:anti-sigma factor n=1 Tax=Bacillus arachidis TaxID=2819290 RepID=UPI00255C9814|nr:anti-sigma factor [Bacillus arachidis]WIY59650.1 anti-sigma factor [Bacillus arachidis]